MQHLDQAPVLTLFCRRPPYPAKVRLIHDCKSTKPPLTTRTPRLRQLTTDDTETASRAQSRRPRVYLEPFAAFTDSTSSADNKILCPANTASKHPPLPDVTLHSRSFTALDAQLAASKPSRSQCLSWLTVYIHQYYSYQELHNPPYSRHDRHPTMASDSDSILSTPKIKQEAPELQPIAAGRKKAAKKDPDRPKKRNLVRWDGKSSKPPQKSLLISLPSDDLDKQVLLTLQWACNEVGVKIPCKCDPYRSPHSTDHAFRGACRKDDRQRHLRRRHCSASFEATWQNGEGRHPCSSYTSSWDCR